MGKIVYGSQWDIDNLKKIGVKIADNYTIQTKDPVITRLSSCDSAGIAALRAAHAKASKCTRVIGEEEARASCKAKYAAFAKQYPNYYATIAQMASPRLSAADVQKIIESGSCSAVGGGTSCGTTRSSCSSCKSLIKAKKQKYNRKKSLAKRTKSKPKTKKTARRKYKR
jgi:hypothetical protein